MLLFAPVRSELLGKVVPEASDIEVEDFDRFSSQWTPKTDDPQESFWRIGVLSYIVKRCRTQQ